MCNTVSFMEHFYHHYCHSENKISTVHQEKKIPSRAFHFHYMEIMRENQKSILHGKNTIKKMETVQLYGEVHNRDSHMVNLYHLPPQSLCIMHL